MSGDGCVEQGSECASVAEEDQDDANGELDESLEGDTALEADKRRKKKEERKQEFKLPEPLFTWRRLLKEVWTGCESKDGKVELCQSILSEILDNAENPFQVILTIHKICPDYSAQKQTSLAGFVIRYFDTWLRKSEDFELLCSRCLTPKLKMEAFAVATAKHSTHLPAVSDAFNLKHPEMFDFILESVAKMISHRNYRDAINCATYFGLQSFFGLEDLVIPCMLQDRGTAVEAYLKGHRQMQVDLVRFFDSLIGLSDSKVEAMFDSYRKARIMTIPMTKLQRKTLEKMVAKLLSIYGLSSEEATPHLMRCRQEGSLRHMAFKRFAEQSVSDEGYTDYVAHALTDDRHLQEYFITHLCNIGQSQEAVRWVVYCNLLDRPPYRVRPYLNNHSIRCAFEMIQLQLASRPSVNGIELFDGHPIVMVDSTADLQQLCPQLQKATVIGLDTEWKPLFLCTTEQVALIQVAVEHRTYLVDVVRLEDIVSEELWIDFFRSLFCSESSVKLGFDLANDFRVLRTSFPFLEAIQPEMRKVVCLVKLVNNLMSENSSLIDLTPTNATGAVASTSGESVAQESASDECLHFRLTDLCEKVLGSPLDKKEQVGNWAMRPLRAEQMRYAAMDAYCLIKVFEQLKAKAMELNLRWTAHLAESDVGFQKPKESKKTKRKTMGVDDNEFNEMIQRVNEMLSKSTPQSRRPADLKIIVDSMMLGLGKHLRRCGIDTILADTRNYLVNCARMDPQRIILTSGRAYNELRSHRSLYASNRVVCIPGLQSMSAIEQVEFVLKQFRVHLSKEDIFSRCMKCNSVAFVLVPSPVLEAMYQANVAMLNPFNDEDYDAEKHHNKIRKVVAEDYAGYGCTLVADENDSSNGIVICENGTLDIMKCSVTYMDHETSVQVMVEKVPPTALEKKGRLFYVCGDCGKVYWDGFQLANYNAFAEALFADDPEEG